MAGTIPRFFFEYSGDDPVMRALIFSRKFSLFEKGDSVVVGVSGGRDSVFLLHLFLLFRSKFGISEVICAHFNHMTRGSESERDEFFVKALAERLGLKCVVGRATRKLCSEAEMREERYEFLGSVASDMGASKIATAHTLDDQLETFIINIIRGGGLFSSLGIRPFNLDLVKRRVPLNKTITVDKPIAVVRPLLSVRRSDIERFLRERKIDYIEDITNIDISFLRSKVRAFLSLLPDELYSKMLDGFFRFWLNIFAVLDFIHSLYKERKDIIPDFISKQIELYEKYGDLDYETFKRNITKKTGRR